MNRYLCRGNRRDNGEPVTGYYLYDEQVDEHYICRISGRANIVDVNVYPATVEPVKMNPLSINKHDFGCPNCGEIVGNTRVKRTINVYYDFCPNCGQALNWAEESAGGFNE